MIYSGLRKVLSCLALSKLDRNQRALKLCKWSLEAFPNTLSLACHRRLLRQCSHRNLLLIPPRSAAASSQDNQKLYSWHNVPWETQVVDTKQGPAGSTDLHCGVLGGSVTNLFSIPVSVWDRMRLCEPTSKWGTHLMTLHCIYGHSKFSVGSHVGELQNEHKHLLLLFSQVVF